MVAYRGAVRSCIWPPSDHGKLHSKNKCHKSRDFKGISF